MSDAARLFEFMRRKAILSAAWVLASAAFAADPPNALAPAEHPSGHLIDSVSVDGSHPQIPLDTRAGATYDTAAVEKDVRTLYRTGRFSDIRVEVQEGEAGKQVTFYVVEKPRLTLGKLRTAPDDFRYKAEIPAGTPIDTMRAQTIATEFRRQLEQQGYADPVVTPTIVPTDTGKADLTLHVRTGDSIRVGAVGLIGDTGLEKREVLGALQSLKGQRVLPGIPGLWKGWARAPEYNAIGVASDVARLRSLFLSRGYFDAVVRLDHTGVFRDKATVNLLLKPGTQYRVRKWHVSGTGMDSRAGAVTGSFRAADLCECLFDLRLEAERAGILDFDVRLAIKPVETRTTAEGEVDLFATVTRGRPYRIRRTEFTGNRRFSDSTIRANMLLDESDLLNSTLLRKSLDRLNGSSLFEPVGTNNVDVITDNASGLADVRIRVKERKFGSWLLSGPVGPMSIAGPFQFTLASRLPAWGRGLLELSSWYANFSILTDADLFSRVLGGSAGKKILPVVALQRPFIPAQGWASGISLSPQLEWRGSLANYASTQLRERALPWISGSQTLNTAMPVWVERPDGNAVMICEPAQPRLKWLRTGAALAVQFATSVPVL